MSETHFQRLKKLAPTISVGLLTADLMRLGEEVEKLRGTGVEIVHFDIMDGVFCPMMTVGPPYVRGVQTDYLKDVHLMIEDPLAHLDAFVAAGADLISIHVESTLHIHRALQYLGEQDNANDPVRGLVRGVALNPGTPIQAVEPLLSDLEMVTLIGINPGWGGQKIVPNTRERILQVRDLAAKQDRDILVAVDGGITRENISEIAAWGPDLVVTGSAVFDGKTPHENAKMMLAALQAG